MSQALNWRNPDKELPKVGEVVWVLLQHWKKNGAQSCEIYAGIVEEQSSYVDPTLIELVVCNLDDYGQGSSTWILHSTDEFWKQTRGCNAPIAWLPEKELNIPKWGWL